LINLIISVLAWTATAFGFYLINFEIKYMPGSIYLNVLMASVAESLAKPAACIEINRCGLKKAYLVAFSLACGGACMLMLSNGRYDTRLVTGLCIFVTKFGLSMAFMINYLAIVELFPTLFCATAAGMCNFLARLGTIFAPMIAEMTPPFPLLLLLFMGTTSGILTIFLQMPSAVPEKDDLKSKK